MLSVLAPAANVKMDGGLARHQWPAGCDCFERRSAISPHRSLLIHSEKPQARIALHHEATQRGQSSLLDLEQKYPVPNSCRICTTSRLECNPLPVRTDRKSTRLNSSHQ